MPIPIILAGLAAAVAQSNAKDTNEKAKNRVQDAKELYDVSKQSLEKAQEKTENSLLKLGNSKKVVLETSIKQFLVVFDRIKNIEFSESDGLNEINNFIIEEQGTLQLREMSDIYQATFSSSVAGAATGAIISLAASGSLPVVTGILSTAGTAFAAGEVGVAAGLAGSALSFGAAMTPLAAIAAPAVLFSGISASFEAGDNLKKAEKIYAEAEVASEKMKISETLCVAIADRADMFDDLLNELNEMFSYCTDLLDDVTKRKMGIFQNRVLVAKRFSEDELKLAAVTRALAGAIKAVIDTPILSADGQISDESKKVHKDVYQQLPEFTKTIDEIKKNKKIMSGGISEVFKKLVLALMLGAVFYGCINLCGNTVKLVKNGIKNVVEHYSEPSNNDYVSIATTDEKKIEEVYIEETMEDSIIEETVENERIIEETDNENFMLQENTVEVNEEETLEQGMQAEFEKKLYTITQLDDTMESLAVTLTGECYMIFKKNRTFLILPTGEKVDITYYEERQFGASSITYNPYRNEVYLLRTTGSDLWIFKVDEQGNQELVLCENKFDYSRLNYTSYSSCQYFSDGIMLCGTGGNLLIDTETWQIVGDIRTKECLKIMNDKVYMVGDTIAQINLQGEIMEDFEIDTSGASAEGFPGDRFYSNGNEIYFAKKDGFYVFDGTEVKPYVIVTDFVGFNKINYNYLHVTDMGIVYYDYNEKSIKEIKKILP